MMEKLYALDIYGIDYSFRENRRTKFHTKFTLFISILTIIASIVISIMFGKEIFINKIPTVNTGQILVDYNETIVPYKNFPYMLEIVDSDTFENLKFESFFDLQTVEYNSAGPKQFKSNITNCTNVIDDKYQNFFAELYQRSLCYKIPDDFFFSNANDINARFLITRIRNCDKTNNPNCRNIFEKHRNVNIFIHFLMPIINSQDYNNVVSYRLNNIRYRLSNTAYYDSIFTLRNDMIKTDRGKIFDEIRLDDFVSIDRTTKDLIPKDVSNSLVINFVINSTNLRTIIERRYIKFQDLFAKIGGIFNALFIIGYLISFYSTEFHFKFFVYNSITSLVDTNKKNAGDIANISSEVQVNNINSVINLDFLKNNKSFPEFEQKNKMKIQKILENSCQYLNNNNDNTEYLEIDKSLNTNNNNLEFVKRKHFNEFIKHFHFTISNVIDENNNLVKVMRKEFILNKIRTDLELSNNDNESTNDYLKYLSKQYLCCKNLNLKQNYIFEKALSFRSSIQSSYKYSLDEL